MLLQDFFDQLTYSELAQVSIGNIDAEGIVPEVYPHVVSQINLGLVALAKRFPLKVVTVRVQEYDTINLYRLHTDFAVTGAGAEPIRYIEDTVDDPFQNNVLKIEYFKDYTDAENPVEVPFNILTNSDSILKRTHDSFYIPDTSDLRPLNVTYRATLDSLDINTLDPDTDEIAIPPVLNEAMLYYVAARLHANRPTIDGQENTSMKYLQMYEAEVAKIDNEDLLIEADFENHKLDTNGWR